MTGSSSDPSSSSSRYFSTSKESEGRKAAQSNFVTKKLFFSCFAFGASVLFADTILKNNLLSSDKASFLSKVIFPFTYPVSALKRITNYWTEIDDTLLLGCAPMNFLGHPKNLHKQNVRGVINLCDEYQGPKEAYSQLGIEQLYLPVIDHSEPSYLQMTTAVDFISKYKMRGERVLVHCKAGHARSASVALCWLLNEDPSLAPPAANMALEGKRNVKESMYLRENVRKFHAQLLKSRELNKSKNTDDILSDNDDENSDVCEKNE